MPATFPLPIRNLMALGQTNSGKRGQVTAIQIDRSMATDESNRSPLWTVEYPGFTGGHSRSDLPLRPVGMVSAVGKLAALDTLVLPHAEKTELS